jgi:uncharacterized protein
MSPALSRAAWVRIIPFAAFMLLLAARGTVPGDGSWGFDPRWIYAITVVIVGGLLAALSREYGELARQTLPVASEALLAIAVGALVFLLWIHVDWVLVAFRIAGAALVVPLMEELFWRSFLMRWIQQPVFEGVDPRHVGLKAIVLSTFVFTLAHTLWLAAVIAGLSYAWLYVRTGKLWVPVIAHAVTNGMLGVWVVMTGNWQFW